MLPLPSTSTPSLRSGANDWPSANSWRGDQLAGNANGSTGTSTPGYAKRSGIHMPWSSPPSATACAGRPASRISCATRGANAGAPGAS